MVSFRSVRGLAVAISRAFKTPVCVSIPAIKRVLPGVIPAFSSTARIASSARRTSSGVSIFGKRTMSGRARTTASRSSCPNGVDSALTLTITSTFLGRFFKSVLKIRNRAASFSATGTESSRS